MKVKGLFSLFYAAARFVKKSGTKIGTACESYFFSLKPTFSGGPLMTGVPGKMVIYGGFNQLFFLSYFLSLLLRRLLALGVRSAFFRGKSREKGIWRML